MGNNKYETIAKICFTALTDYFNLLCLKHEIKSKDFTHVHSIGKAGAHFSVYFI